MFEFNKVLKQYPNSAKVPDALLKIGFAQIELGDKKSALATLEGIVKSHPTSTAARLAKKRLISVKGG